MEINLNSNAGVRRDTLDANVNNVGFEASAAPHASRPASSLEITSGVGGIASAEPTAEVPESELRRDDALGNLVNSAFNFQAPPLPDFGKNLV